MAEVASTGTNLVICHCKDSQTQECMDVILGRSMASEREWNANKVNERP